MNAPEDRAKTPEASADARAPTRKARADGFQPWTGPAWLRFGWAVASVFVVESVVLGLATLPAVTFWVWHFQWDVAPWPLRVIVLSMSFVPAYLIFAVALMFLSAWATRLLDWRPKPDLELRIAELPWPMLDWVRYSIVGKVVRILAGTFLCATPIWVWYMRLNGARIGRRVYVNSLDVTDHCLLEFGDDVVIGAAVHLSGHTVERGLLRTGRVRLARGVTVGVNANVEIGVEAGPNCQIGALCAVPKYAKLDGDSTYVGAPARKLERSSAAEGPGT